MAEGAPIAIRMTGGMGMLRMGHQCAIVLAGWSLIGRQDTLGPIRSVLTAKAISINEHLVVASATYGTKPRLGLCMGTGTWWVWSNVDLLSKPTLRLVEVVISGDPEARVNF